jgi:thiol-disulfide isomerase/thioredoxin
MNYYYGMAWLLGLFLWQSPLYSQSVNLDSFQQIQALNIQNCAVVQVNASWNYQNRVKIEKLSKLCYVGEIDLSNKQIGAVIQKEWNIKIVPTIIIFENGKEVKRYEPGVSMRFDEQEVFDKIKKEIK